MVQTVGIQLDIRLTQTLPRQIAQWLSIHVMGGGHPGRKNQIMGTDNPTFPNWKGGFFRLVEDHPKYGTHWHLKTNGTTEDYSVEHLSFFLHELQPWNIMKEKEVVARVIGEDQTSYEKIFWWDQTDTLVVMQNGARYTMDNTHPKNWSANKLMEELLTTHDYPDNGGWRKFYYPVNAVVSPKQEEKRILARQYNEKRELDKIKAKEVLEDK